MNREDLGILPSDNYFAPGLCRILSEKLEGELAESEIWLFSFMN
jgi:hypothetical protein